MVRRDRAVELSDLRVPERRRRAHGAERRVERGHRGSQQGAVDAAHLAAEGGLQLLEDAAERQVAQQLEDTVLVGAVEDERRADDHV